MRREFDIPASYELLFRVSFEHAFFADGVLRELRIVPVPACFDMLRRAGLLLQAQQDGIAAYGDAHAVARLRLHIAHAGASLGMAFQVFFTDPQFFGYTAPAWPSGKLLFLDTADSVTDETGCRIAHATPVVEGSAFLERVDPRLVSILGERVLAPTPAMVLQVDVSASFLDAVDSRQRHFHVRFAAAGGQSKDSRTAAGEVPAGDISFDRYTGVGTRLFSCRGQGKMTIDTNRVPVFIVRPHDQLRLHADVSTQRS